MALEGFATPGTIAAVSAVALPGARWALNLWAAVRREGIAAAASRDNARMVDALLAQATAAATLAGAQAALSQRIDQLSGKLDTIAKEREWTPVEIQPVERVDSEESASNRAPTSDSQRSRGRLRTVPKGVPLSAGWRAPRPGTNHDE